MRGVIIPLPNTSSWRGALLRTSYVFMAWYLVKHRDNFIFTDLDLDQGRSNACYLSTLYAMSLNKMAMTKRLYHPDIKDDYK
jgi:hypothetical protein